MPIVLSQRHVRKSEKTLRVSIAVALALCGAGIFRLWALRAHVASLEAQIRSQKSALAGLTVGQPVSNVRAPSGTDPLAQLQQNLESATQKYHCTIEEFQASPDRVPYISAFTHDTNEPDWQQIPVHVTLQGTLASVLGAVDRLHDSDLPLEPDSIEITRDSPADQHTSVVSLRITFRVLTWTGGKA
ncbi:MAG TPA: hypothetical protein VMI31_19085 [Fimbriimonadaceae bacterium]|nr:hypothetical protein [Fimbriimonadaceae bacterium]